MTKYFVFGLSLALILALWCLDHTATSLSDSTQRVGELERSNESRKNTQRLLAQLDTEHTQERERANQTNASLRAAVAAGEHRLSVLSKCPIVRTATAAPGVDDAEARAELDTAAAVRIVAIPNDGDDAIRQLTGLQDYVTRVCLAK